MSEEITVSVAVATVADQLEHLLELAYEHGLYDAADLLQKLIANRTSLYGYDSDNNPNPQLGT